MSDIDLTQVTSALSPKQIRSVVEAEARINLWEGSVRSGKTIASLLKWLMFVANPPRGGELVMVGRTRDSIFRNAFGPLTNPDIFGTLASQVHYNNGAPTATILGRTVHVLGANDAKAEPKVRGMTGAGAYVDEGTTIPKDFFDQLNARCSVPGARLFVTTNPDNPAHWLRKQYMLRPTETSLRSWHFQLDDNPHLPAEYVATLKSTYVGLWYRRFILGHWVQAEGAVYDMWDEQRHVVDVLPQIVQWISVGVDYGTTNPFAALMLALGVDGRLYLTREYRYDSKLAHRSLTDAEYSQRLRAWLAQGEHPQYVVVDPSAKSFRVQLHNDGIVSTLGNNDVVDGIRTVASLLATGQLLVHRSCEGWIEEVAGYAWDDEKAEDGEDVPIKADDHSLDAGRYGIFTTRAVWQHQLREPVLPAA
ncbi:PBSX family phage terminase large subunit [Streptosporangium jomthongense]|uniref:PBSX family phage terminase large subunit n=1 Tax=Streptosporangium jomthongense TaxID=1193683 RepID=A0ABV8EX40_9ACTN